MSGSLGCLSISNSLSSRLLRKLSLSLEIGLVFILFKFKYNNNMNNVVSYGNNVYIDVYVL